jgi:hypothetical protein
MRARCVYAQYDKAPFLEAGNSFPLNLARRFAEPEDDIRILEPAEAKDAPEPYVRVSAEPSGAIHSTSAGTICRPQELPI